MGTCVVTSGLSECLAGCLTCRGCGRAVAESELRRDGGRWGSTCWGGGLWGEGGVLPRMDGRRGLLLLEAGAAAASCCCCELLPSPSLPVPLKDCCDRRG